MIEILTNILATGVEVGAIITTVAINVAVAYAAYWIASQFAPEQEPTSFRMPKASSYPIQTAMKGGCVPKVYGTRRVAGNIIWCGPPRSYEVAHQTGETPEAGKGGGGGGEPIYSYETRYMRSFLIAVCEGPAHIIRMWKGKKEINPATVFRIEWEHQGWFSDDREKEIHFPITVFEGLNNTGLRDLTGEDYGDWPNLCCVFFEDYDLGNTQAIPNFSFEVSKISDYIVGTNYTTPYTYNILAKVNLEDEIDENWGESGFFGYEKPGDGAGTYTPYSFLHLSDGSFIASFYRFDFDGSNYAYLCKVKADGSLDTDWGNNGFFTRPNASAYWLAFYKILMDNDGNIYAFGQGGGSPSYGFVKIDSDGNYVKTLMSGSYTFIGAVDAVWYDDAKTKIIVISSSDNTVQGTYPVNILVVDLTTEDLDSSFTGNVGLAGCADFGGGYKIRKLSDGDFVTFQNGSPTMQKFLSNGSALDTDWGDSGTLDLGTFAFNAYCERIIVAGDYIYCIANKTVSGHINNIIYKIDSTGTIEDQHNIVTDNNGTYHCIQKLGSKLILGTTSSSPANYSVEFWSTDLEYESGFDLLDDGQVPTVIFFIYPRAYAYDMNPADIIEDIIENNRYGAGQSDIIDGTSLDACRTYWANENMLISIVLDESKPWQDWIDYILSHCGGLRFNSGGELHFGVLKDETAVATLTDEDLVQPNPDTEDLPPKVNITQRPQSETFNRIEVQWTDRDNKYDNSVAIAYDPVDQARTGTIRKRTVKLSGICDADFAQRMAWRFLIDGLYRFHIYKFSVTFKNSLLENNDVISLSDNHLLTDGQKVRIMNIQEDQNGRDLSITAMDDYAEHYPDVSGYSTQQTLYTPDTEITIDDLEDVEVNFREDYNTNKLYLSIVPGNAYINGGFVYRSYDDTTYQLIGKFGLAGVTGGDANSEGTITSSLPAHGSMTWSPDESVLVSIGTVTDLKTTISEDMFWHDRYLARIGTEIIAFKEAEETETEGIWKISNLRRGCFGTEPIAHSPGETFYTLYPDFTYTYSEQDVGRTLYFKVVAYYKDVYQSIADIDGVSVTPQGHYLRPGPASFLRLSADENDNGYQYSGSSFTLYWNNPEQTGSWDILTDGEPLYDTIEDPRLKGITLKFEQTDGTAIGQRDIEVAEQATITKNTDLGGLDDAVIKVIPRIILGSRLENSLQVEAV